MQNADLEKICKLLRYDILRSTTEAGTGHPTSSMSGVELAATLFFGGPPAGGFFKFDPLNPQNPLNDRFVLSKGHASPLLYSIYHAAGWITEKELMSLRKFNSIYEGHPTPRIPYVDAATGSLGQGLSVGVGMALGMKLRIEHRTSNMEQKKVPSSTFNVPKTFVLLGDSEMAEGQIWEAMEIASHYHLDNLVAILDVNRLGQRGETMLAWDLDKYAHRAEAFGWDTIIVDNGHNLEHVYEAFQVATSGKSKGTPKIIIAKTDKGHGVSFLSNKDDWHGKPLPKDKLPEALKELGEVDLKIRGKVSSPSLSSSQKRGSIPDQVGNDKKSSFDVSHLMFKIGDLVATREAYGEALSALGKENSDIIALDGEVSNSTYADKFKKAFPERFLEMYIAEQNMVSAALGISKLGFIPFASSFAAFLSRAYDQIRMAQYSGDESENAIDYSSSEVKRSREGSRQDGYRPVTRQARTVRGQAQSGANIKLVGSHAGVSIGPDGASQMALEDLAMMRAILDSVVFYPSDGISTAQLTKIMAESKGLFYLRTTREKTPVIYKKGEKFKIGGSKVIKQSENDTAVVFAAGITLHEALKAHEELKKEGINIAIVDLYSVKPLDNETVKQLSSKTKNVIVVEDHYPAGGLGEAVLTALANFKFQISNFKFTHLCVRKLPHSGTPQELLAYEEIDAAAIVKAVKGF